MLQAWIQNWAQKRHFPRAGLGSHDFSKPTSLWSEQSRTLCCRLRSRSCPGIPQNPFRLGWIRNTGLLSRPARGALRRPPIGRPVRHIRVNNVSSANYSFTYIARELSSRRAEVPRRVYVRNRFWREGRGRRKWYVYKYGSVVRRDLTALDKTACSSAVTANKL